MHDNLNNVRKNKRLEKQNLKISNTYGVENKRADDEYGLRIWYVYGERNGIKNSSRQRIKKFQKFFIQEARFYQKTKIAARSF